jgi:hypothetical protein
MKPRFHNKVAREYIAANLEGAGALYRPWKPVGDACNISPYGALLAFGDLGARATSAP